MKNIRIWFKKTETAKYISHLDLSRCMSRAIHKAKLPFWYTEGFNPHVFLTITMPISLGYSGLRESMDVKLLDDDMPYSEIIEKMNSGLPKDIQTFAVTEQVMKPSDVAYSYYEILLESEDSQSLMANFDALLSKEQILVEKRSKKGMREVDIKPDFFETKFDILNEKMLKLSTTLQTGNQGSINPRLLFDAYFNSYGVELFPEVTRVNSYNENMEEFL